MKVSFDFDCTLTKPCVQRYAEYLLSRGVEIFVVTSRPRVYPAMYGTVLADNSDLFSVTDRLGINRGNIIFTGFRPKDQFIPDGAVFHLDDDCYEIATIQRTVPVQVNQSFSIRKCNELLKHTSEDKNVIERYSNEGNYHTTNA